VAGVRWFDLFGVWRHRGVERCGENEESEKGDDLDDDVSERLDQGMVA
jgi:hypothetical protein